MMSSHLIELRRTGEQSKLVEIDREPLDDEPIIGFVVGVSEKLVLLHLLDDNMYLNGYAVTAVADIKRYREVEDDDSIAARALLARGLSPEVPEAVDGRDWASLLQSVHHSFPLVAIHRERIDPEVCQIGRITDVAFGRITLEEIDTAGEWIESEHYNTKDITRVDFGGSYERALWLVNCIESGDTELIAAAREADGLE